MQHTRVDSAVVSCWLLGFEAIGQGLREETDHFQQGSVDPIGHPTPARSLSRATYLSMLWRLYFAYTTPMQGWRCLLLKLEPQ